MIATEALARIYDRNTFDGEPSSDALMPWRYRAQLLPGSHPKGAWGIYDEAHRRFLDEDELTAIDVDEMLTVAADG